MRETFPASQSALARQFGMPSQDDLLADGRWLFEIGGKDKRFTQINVIENSHVAADKIGYGHGSKTLFSLANR